MSYLPPSENDVESGVKYSVQVSLRSNDFRGSIFGADDPDDKPTWQFKTEPPRHAWSPVNLLLGKPAFVLLDREAREIVRIRRRKRIPPCFEIVANAAVVGEIRRLGMFTYRIYLAGGPSWMFRIPPFTHHFCAISDGCAGAWAAVVSSEMNWAVLVRPESDDLRLLAALAFIHRERCVYT